MNLDEIPFYYDMCKDFTLNKKGEKEIKLLSHKGAKYRLSLCPTITSLGEFLSPLVVFLYRNDNREFPKKTKD